MLRGHHLMLKTPGSRGITWSWKQQLVGVNRTCGISWTITKNMKIGKYSKILDKQVKMLLFLGISLNLLAFIFSWFFNWFWLSYSLLPTFFFPWPGDKFTPGHFSQKMVITEHWKMHLLKRAQKYKIFFSPTWELLKIWN